MAQDHFDWALIKSFIAVLDAGSLMGAARQLGAQQPTLSRHITELESQLGTPLFERTGRGVVPTAAALAVADAARAMELGALALSRTLAGQRATTTGVVRVSVSQIAASYLMPPVLAALQAAEPGIQIELVASNAVSNLLRREADIAVRMLRPAQSSLVAKKLGEVHVVACAHTSYLKRAGVPTQAQDLLRHRLIGYEKDATILRGFARLGAPLTRANFHLRTDDQIAYGCLVAAGCGIGFVGHYSLPYLPGVVQILPMLKVPPLPCWLAVHREIRGNLIVRRVYDFLAATLPPALARDP